MKPVAERRVLIFTSPSCSSCKRLINELVPESRIDVIDVEELPDQAKRYDVTSLPTVMFLKNKIVQESQHSYHPSLSKKIVEFLRH